MFLKNAGGNWTAVGTWSASSASGGDSVGPPLASTDCVAELLSSNVTIDSGAVCRSFDTTSGTGSYGGTITHTSGVAWTIGDGTDGAGNVAFKLNSGVTYTKGSATSSSITFANTSNSGTAQTIDYAGKIPGNQTWNGTNGKWQITGTAPAANTSATWTVTAGNFDLNGKTISIQTFNGSGSTTRTVTLGAAAITIGSQWTFTDPTGLTFSGASSTITCNGTILTFAGGGLTYGTVNMTGSSSATVSGANTFTNWTRTGTAATTDILVLSANQTVTGTNMPTFTGNSITNRLFIKSDVRGTQRTITNTSATPAVTNCDFEDIAFANAVNLSAVSGGTGDCGGNSGITFTTGQTNYATAAVSYSESDTTKWFLGTGGSGGAGRVPLPQDTGIFEMTTGSRTITLDMPRHGTLSFAGIANTPALTNNTAATHYGSLTLNAGLGTYSGTATLTFSTRGSISITSATKTVTNPITVDAPGGTVTFADALTSTGTTNTLTQGTYAVSNVTHTIVAFASSNSNTRTLTKGSGTWTLTGNAATIWNTATSTNMTFTTRPAITCNYSGATGTRTISHGSTAGGTEANSLDMSVTAGTDAFTLTSPSVFHNVNFTGYAGVMILQSMYYGNLTLGGGTTVGSGALTFAATSGTQVVTTSGIIIDRPITINCPGATFQLADNLAQGTTTSRAVTWTAGTIDLQSFTWTHFGTWTLSSTGTRVLAGSGTLNLTLDTVSTPWTYSGSNFTVSGTPTIKYSSTTNNAQTFAGGGASYKTVTFDRGASTSAITISGSNTYSVKLRDLGTAAHTLKTTAGTTQTMADFDDGIAGRGTNVLTLDSTTTGTYAWAKTGGGTITINYCDVQHMVATPTVTWLALNSTNHQGTATAGSGVYFGAFSSLSTLNGLGMASVKTVNGLAIASVKTINGLA